ncbi:Zn(II)2Cys6 transcription factor domain-containing protein [Aspergillus fijiensis CBS 313.89]|uniref:C6 finger domain protein n=1 Tax=Aspergillus fijiensis CBS 313.89 TaxID=1448319 RepID=A0A8G1RZ85_9EURO|nr:C6 finger domain protein [Aspergillus fijiensis CBS 313.89]RAK81038.1 C6 finger domain protein [Aspergillus fijiensis CBS 313.89]
MTFSAIPESNPSSSPRGHSQSERDSSNRKKRKGPRLAHRKSRTGCQRCRARRVKCDEARPVCRDCHRHGIPCVYDRPAEEIQSRPLQPSSSDPSNIELRLLHHFTLFASATLPGAQLKRVKDCWSIDVPRLAFGYKPLLHAVFAISALHLSKANPNEAGLLDIHCNFLEQALREHRLCIGGITTQTADAVCFTSILLQVDVFATLQNHTVVSSEHVSEWMRLLRGSVAVFDAALEIARHDTHPASIWCIIDTFPIPLRTSSDAGAFSFLLPTAPDDEDNDMALEAYRGAVAHINATWLAMEAKEHPQVTCRRIMVFPLFVITEFMDLLEKRRPRALVVLAYFLALSAPLRDIWWIGDAAHKYIMALQPTLPAHWQRLMSWPVEMIISCAPQQTQAATPPGRSSPTATGAASSSLMWP